MMPRRGRFLEILVFRYIEETGPNPGLHGKFARKPANRFVYFPLGFTIGSSFTRQIPPYHYSIMLYWLEDKLRQGCGSSYRCARGWMDVSPDNWIAEICRPGVHSNPFVEGRIPEPRSSGANAMRSARPNALKTVSAMWWVFRPHRLSTWMVANAPLAKPRKNS
uniref:Uncharacterized protein n=1 Tax=Candidatus Kentrum sp. LFY TaxID=2126342 RepID=A0A450WQD9_9GAMM|nr:MAG: hypothetical protein BECKLFY1418C_GA0070996_10559 [Candidatus Kentron sp. LFY]